MKKENLDDFDLPYIDFYLEIPHHTEDYLEQINPDTSDDHKKPRETGGLNDEQVSQLRRDSLDAAAQDPKPSSLDSDHGLFSSENID